MNLEEYDKFAATTDVSDKELWYYALGLAGESGEFAEKVKKIYRDNGGKISIKMRTLLLKELGDISWYKSRASKYLKSSSSQVLDINVKKLKSRKKRKKLQGSGDNR